MPAAVFRYFWLVFIAVMLVNASIWRHRLRRLEALGGVSRVEADQFLRGAVIAIVAFALALQLIIILSGLSDPLCLLSEPMTAPAVLANTAIVAVAWALLLWWVWMGHGAQTLARLGPALFTRGPVTKREYSAPIVRAVVTGVVTLSLVGSLIARLGVFAQPPNGC